MRHNACALCAMSRDLMVMVFSVRPTGSNHSVDDRAGDPAEHPDRAESQSRQRLARELFTALDEFTARRLRAEFVRLVKENGKTAVFITHSISEALEIGDVLAV
jgi:hypothetical protein